MSHGKIIIIPRKMTVFSWACRCRQNWFPVVSMAMRMLSSDGGRYLTESRFDEAGVEEIGGADDLREVSALDGE